MTTQRIQELERQKNEAYAERNQCVALIARMAIDFGLEVGVAQHPAEDASWDDDWRTIVFIDLPEGQVSWHLHDSDKHLVADLPLYPSPWDGHTTAEKYRRVNESRGFKARSETDCCEECRFVHGDGPSRALEIKHPQCAYSGDCECHGGTK